MNKLLLLTVAALLASCNQAPKTPPSGKGQTPSPNRVTQAQSLQQSVYNDDPDPQLTLAANGGYAFVDMTEATWQLQMAGLRFRMPAAVPAWAEQFRAGDGRFADGVFQLGQPLEVASTVAFPQTEGPAQLSSEEVAQLSNVALVPLQLNDGRVAGLVRIPLYRNTPPQTDTSEFVLFSEPVDRLTSPDDALMQSQLGGGNPVVVAVAVSADGQRYSPFDVRWVVADANQPDKVALVALGLPVFSSSQGEQFMPEGQALSFVNALPPASLEEARAVQEHFSPPKPLEYSRVPAKKGRPQ